GLNVRVRRAPAHVRNGEVRTLLELMSQPWVCHLCVVPHVRVVVDITTQRVSVTVPYDVAAFVKAEAMLLIKVAVCIVASQLILTWVLALLVLSCFCTLVHKKARAVSQRCSSRLDHHI